MQDPNKRSLRLTGLAVSMAEASIRKWAAKFDWTDRVFREGEASQARACQLYRSLYYEKWRLAEVAVVERRMSVPMLTTSPPPSAQSGVGDAVRSVIASEKEKADIGPGVREKLRDETEEQRALRVIRQGLQLMEGMISVGARQVIDAQKAAQSGGKPAMKVGVGDLVRLLKEYRETSELVGSVSPPSAGEAALEPSVRVEIARQRGTSVTVAMREDTEEVLAILRTIEAAEEVDAEWSAPASVGEMASITRVVGRGGEAS